MTDDNNPVAPATTTKHRKYLFWVLCIILFISLTAWGIQRFFISPYQDTIPQELVWYNNLKIDMHHPDVLIESESLSRLPKDLLNIPFLRDTLTEDFIFYYQNNADRLGITGSLRRIIFEHDLQLRDNLLEMLLDQPTNIGLWHDQRGRLSHFILVVKLNGLARMLEPIAEVAAKDSQLARTEFPPLQINNSNISVYRLSYGYQKELFFASHGDNLLLFSDIDMLYDQEMPSQDSSTVIQDLLSGHQPWPKSYGLEPRQATQLTQSASSTESSKKEKNAATTHPVTKPIAHRLSVSANYLGFGYQRFVPALAGVRFEMQQEGWTSYLALNESALAPETQFDFNPIWRTMPTGASLCLALPVSSSVPDYLLQRLDSLNDKSNQSDGSDEKLEASLSIKGASGLCWYPNSNLYTPLVVSQLASNDMAPIDARLGKVFHSLIGAREKQVIPVITKSEGQSHLWQREVSSRYGQYGLNEAENPESLLGPRFFRVTLARNNQSVLFSLDDQLVNNALQTLNKNFPPLVDTLPKQSVVMAYMAPNALSTLLEQEVFPSLPKNVEPIFNNAAQTLLVPKLQALASQQNYALVLPPGTAVTEKAWQWLPLTWQGL